ncbi:hypothetical protein OJAV_G00179510 [Oryzias javanicus]|uniref:Ferric-chelate reductase 1 n=1 Tax=Oryzias javanicus TaxID=123683 RepID=A0A437CC06_ORYJA|nr:hypothetical protein OJAV_G00179510 [Oryzias javanicus]
MYNRLQNTYNCSILHLHTRLSRHGQVQTTARRPLCDSVLELYADICSEYNHRKRNNTRSKRNNTRSKRNNTRNNGNNTRNNGNNTRNNGNNTRSNHNEEHNAVNNPIHCNNTSVETLATTVNRNECGKTQLCAAEPSTCDPSAGASCFFLGAQKKDGNNFEFALSGESDGYIAASVLSPFNNKEVTYICANKNNAVKFFGAVLENGGLTITNVSANSVKGKVNGKKIQCTFLATVPDTNIPATKRARRATDVTLSVSTGPFNASSDSPGAPTRVIKAAVADLANANITVSNDITNSTNTTTAPTTNTTTAPTTTTTTAPTSAVGSLQTDLNSTDCGSGKLCASEPKSCNPATGNTCSFLSAKQKSGQIYSFELSGLSDGYIASAVSTDTTAGNGDSTYVCANNNGAVKFITAIFNNSQLTETSLNVTSGSVHHYSRSDLFNDSHEWKLRSHCKFFGKTCCSGENQSCKLVRSYSKYTNLASGVAPHYHPLMQALLITFGILVLTMFGH